MKCIEANCTYLGVNMYRTALRIVLILDVTQSTLHSTYTEMNILGIVS